MESISNNPHFWVAGEKGTRRILFTAGVDTDYSGLGYNYIDLYYEKHKVNNCVIGNRTRIKGMNWIIFDQSHDYKSVFMGYIPELAIEDGTKHQLGLMCDRINRKGQLIIGSDCTIEEECIMLAGITIGDGAIVRKNSVVVKDVPPYAIVQGNPAKVVGYRYDEETIERLCKIQWWNFDDETIERLLPEIMNNTENFAKEYYEQVEFYPRKSGEIVPVTKEGIKRMAFFVDGEDDFPIFPHVVEEFLDNFPNGEAELIVFYHDDNEWEKINAQAIVSVLEDIGECDAIINMCAIPDDMDEAIMSEMDYYLPNRSYETIRRIDYANKYGVTILPSVNIPIFEKKDAR